MLVYDNGGEGGDATTLSPDDAFSVLGNDTRMDILQTLGEADQPLSFSELRDRIGVRDSGQFNYHLGKLEGHFVSRTTEGYALRQAGRRVIEAVLSGAVTDAPVLERTPIDQSCHYCGAALIEVSYREEQVGMYCPQCKGTYGGTSDPPQEARPADQERLGYAPLPPAGIHGRTAEEIVQAASTWFMGEIVTVASGVCPRCSAPVRKSTTVCEEHDTTGELCNQCDRRYAVTAHHHCTNCLYELESVLGMFLFANLELRAFLIEHGLDPVAPSPERFFEATVYAEEILSTDPLTARFTFTVDGDALSLTVDEELTVVETTLESADT